MGDVELTDRMLIFGERQLHPVLADYVAHYNAMRPPTLARQRANVVAGVTHRLAKQVPTGINTLRAADYRSLAELPNGGVLIVGASSSAFRSCSGRREPGRRPCVDS